MNEKSKTSVIHQSIKEYQLLFRYRPKDSEYWEEKRKKGLNHCYITNTGKLKPWVGEEILISSDNDTLNIQDDTFEKKFKKMRVSKHAPKHWRFYHTTERIAAIIPYGKTLKIGDIVELFKNTIKRKANKNNYIITHLPHSMLAGIVLRIKQGKTNCKHIAFVYKNKQKSEDRIVNYTLFYFDYGTPKQSEKFALKVKNLACNLQLKLLPLVKEYNLLSNTEIEGIKSSVSKNLHNNKFDTKVSNERFGSYTIRTLMVGGIPCPIFPRLNCNNVKSGFGTGNKFNR